VGKRRDSKTDPCDMTMKRRGNERRDEGGREGGREEETLKS
jgi:hypothetical protein